MHNSYKMHELLTRLLRQILWIAELIFEINCSKSCRVCLISDPMSPNPPSCVTTTTAATVRATRMKRNPALLLTELAVALIHNMYKNWKIGLINSRKTCPNSTPFSYRRAPWLPHTFTWRGPFAAVPNDALCHLSKLECVIRQPCNTLIACRITSFRRRGGSILSKQKRQRFSTVGLKRVPNNGRVWNRDDRVVNVRQPSTRHRT
mmetsp:Transcript_1795/g.3953  ORF Transcript_1795/g.3953 Transcript_1795/m.3953 type:complete len:205 (-) Transcript_1795:69-683(-)